jgi:hypothetical protein
MELAQNRERWRALVSTFGFHKMRGISWLAAEPVSFSRRTLLHGISNWSSHCPDNCCLHHQWNLSLMATIIFFALWHRQHVQ